MLLGEGAGSEDRGYIQKNQKKTKSLSADSTRTAEMVTDACYNTHFCISLAITYLLMISKLSG